MKTTDSSAGIKRSSVIARRVSSHSMVIRYLPGPGEPDEVTTDVQCPSDSSGGRWREDGVGGNVSSCCSLNYAMVTRLSLTSKTLPPVTRKLMDSHQSSIRHCEILLIVDVSKVKWQS